MNPNEGLFSQVLYANIAFSELLESPPDGGANEGAGQPPSLPIPRPISRTPFGF